MWYGVYKEASRKSPISSEEQMLQVAIDYESGMTQQEIFDKYHIHKKVLQRALDLFDVKKRNMSEALIKSDRTRINNAQEVEKIISEYSSGIPTAIVCKKYNIEPATLYDILDKHNIERTNARPNVYRQNGMKERIVELYRVLKSPENVAKELGVSSGMVRRVLEETNEPIIHETRKKRPVATENQYMEISERYENGESYIHLAREYGVNEYDLKRRLIQEGVYDSERNKFKPRLSQEQVYEAYEMSSYLPTVDVAKHFNINIATLMRLFIDNGLQIVRNDDAINTSIERRTEGLRIIPASEYNKILELKEIDGLKVKEIAKMYDTSHANIADILRRMRHQQIPVQASFNLRRLLQASYSNEIGYLNRYLKEGFDPNDYEFELKTYLENQGQEFDEDLEYYDIAQEWLEKASKEDLEKFKKWVQNRPPSDMTDSPAYEAMSYNSFVKPTWLVHFTDDPYSIAKEGFKYGHEDTHGLALTTWYTNKARKRHAGYNFAFKVGSRDARICARQNKYGKHAVVFWGAGVEAYHSGDEEDQIIIWGPSVNTNLIFPVLNEEGSWVVNDWRNDKLLIKDDDFNKVAEWVVNNNQMLQQIRSKKAK